MASHTQNSPASQTTDQTTGQPKWQFWIDRGGTFTDIVARKPDGSLLTHKLLSENPERYADAAIQGIRELLDVPAGEKIPAEKIEAVKVVMHVHRRVWRLSVPRNPLNSLCSLCGVSESRREGTRASSRRTYQIKYGAFYATNISSNCT